MLKASDMLEIGIECAKSVSKREAPERGIVRGRTKMGARKSQKRGPACPGVHTSQVLILAPGSLILKLSLPVDSE